MKVHLCFLMAACLSCVVSRESSDDNYPNEITPLFPQDLLGIHKNSPVTRMTRVRGAKIDDTQQEMQVVLIGKIAKAKEIMAGFLDWKSSLDQIKAVFVVKDEKAKELIESLLHSGGNLDGMMAVLVIKDHMAGKIIRELLSKDDTEEEVKAVLIVKDQSGKELAESLLNQDQTKEQIEILFLGREDRAKEIIRQFLHLHDKTKEIKVAMVGQHENTKDMMELLLGETETDNDVKIILIGREMKAKEMLGNLLDTRDKTEGIQMSVVNRGDKAKEMLEDVIRKANTDNDLKVVLFNEEGQEQVLSQGFISKDASFANKINTELLSQNERGKFVNEGLIGIPLDPDNCDYEALKNKTDHALQKLEGFFERLKFFILERNFDFNAFESQGSQLYKELTNISSYIRRMAPCNKPILNELDYLKRTFDTMVESIEILKYYETSTAPGHRLMFSLVDLNIRLFALRDFRGEPDPLVEGYSRKVATYARFVSFWGAQFKKYKEVPFGEEMSFKKYYNRVEESLIVLGRQAMTGDDKFLP